MEEKIDIDLNEQKQLLSQSSTYESRRLKILHKIDEIATANSKYGYRLIHAQL